VAPLAFSCFGSYIAKNGNIPLGRCFTIIARSLVDRLGAKEVAGEVMLEAAEVRCYTEPMQALHDLKTEGESAALSVGDTHWACLNRIQYCSDLLWAGTNLSIVHDKVVKAHHFIKQLDANISVFVLIVQRTLNVLLGKEAATLDSTNPRQKMIQ
jgi:hypothetical protein